MAIEAFLTTALVQVMAVELLPESRRVERARVPPYISCHTLSDLLPGTKYIIGVIAFVDHEPKLVSGTGRESGESFDKRSVHSGLPLGSRNG